MLTFKVNEKRHEMLEELSPADSDRVLHACKAMGLDVKIVVDVGAAMLRDIERRGWFINPFRADEDENTPKSH